MLDHTRLQRNHRVLVTITSIFPLVCRVLHVTVALQHISLHIVTKQQYTFLFIHLQLVTNYFLIPARTVR